MSTKRSLALYRWDHPSTIHIYLDYMDNEYYVETYDGKIKVAEGIAKAFAKILTIENKRYE